MWNTKFWEDRVIQFILVISEVNTSHNKKTFRSSIDTSTSVIHAFRRKLDIGLINNDCMTDNTEGMKRGHRMHY